jgi:hypothetical protein
MSRERRRKGRRVIEFGGHRITFGSREEAVAKVLYLACKNEHDPNEGETVELSLGDLRSGMDVSSLGPWVKRVSLTKRQGQVGIVAEVDPSELIGRRRGGLSFRSPGKRGSSRSVALVSRELSGAERETAIHHEVVSHSRHGNEILATLDEVLTGPHPITALLSRFRL